MANEMLSGLLNQTGGGNWWSGSSPVTQGATSGYGSSTPVPAPTTPPAGTPPASGAGGGASGPQTGLEWQDRGRGIESDRAGQMANMHQQELMRLRGYQASFPTGSDRWNKYQQMIQQVMMKIQQQQSRMA